MRLEEVFLTKNAYVRFFGLKGEQASFLNVIADSLSLYFSETNFYDPIRKIINRKIEISSRRGKLCDGNDATADRMLILMHEEAKKRKFKFLETLLLKEACKVRMGAYGKSNFIHIKVGP